MEFKLYLNTSEHEKKDILCNINKTKIGNAVAVYVNVAFYDELDPDFGCGVDITDISKKFFADFRHCEFWCKPFFGTKLGEIPDETQGLLYQRESGEYVVILPVVSKDYKCVLKGTDENTVTAKLFTGCKGFHRCNTLAFVYAEGNNPFELFESCAKAAVKELNNGCKTREKRRYPEILEYLGWCSWDAFQIRVTEQDLINKCEEFKNKNIPVKWVMIDDMWGDVREFKDFAYKDKSEMFTLMYSSTLYSFEADRERFPNGLKHCIDKLKEYGMHIGVWHPTTGYWCGINPDGDIFKELGDTLIKTSDGRYIHSCKQDKAYKFYSAFHDFLQSAGTEFVKIDNQSMTNRFYRGKVSFGEASRSFHNAMEASVGQHFDNAMINCMGMASEDMWNRSQSPVSRCSDDFQPENKAWFAKHIMQCSYNDLIQGQLYYCDWDMWWTDDAQGIKNSILRAISGGPIYVSDTINRSKADLLLPLCLENGKILRCDRPGYPTEDCLLDNVQKNGHIFKLQNIADNCGVVAAFNIDENENCVMGTVSPSDVYDLKGEKFVIYEHFSKEWKVISYDEKINVKLDNADEYKLYIISPIENDFAVIGRTDKFIAPKTVKFASDGKSELLENGPYAYYKNGEMKFIKK